MDVTGIPFNAFLGIERVDGVEPRLALREAANLTNHLGTVHASAQFALAEAASGECLLRMFGDIAERATVVPVVRSAEVKFRKPAQGAIQAGGQIAEDVARKARTALEGRGRALIPVEVTVEDAAANVTMTASFEWFVVVQ